MVEENQLIDLIQIGRLECYVKRNGTYNPYRAGTLYDWEFELIIGRYRFTDSYRGFNPYSGKEYIFENGNHFPVWYGDYVGYAIPKNGIKEKEIYGFLKRARGSQLTANSQSFFDNCTLREGDFEYLSNFTGDLAKLLQIEEISHKGDLVFRQVTAGRLSQGIAIAPVQKL